MCLFQWLGSCKAMPDPWARALLYIWECKHQESNFNKIHRKSNFPKLPKVLNECRCLVKQNKKKLHSPLKLANQHILLWILITFEACGFSARSLWSLHVFLMSVWVYSGHSFFSQVEVAKLQSIIVFDVISVTNYSFLSWMLKHDIKNEMNKKLNLLSRHGGGQSRCHRFTSGEKKNSIKSKCLTVLFN